MIAAIEHGARPDAPERAGAIYRGAIPLHRYARPGEIADAADVPHDGLQLTVRRVTAHVDDLAFGGRVAGGHREAQPFRAEVDGLGVQPAVSPSDPELESFAEVDATPLQRSEIVSF